MSVWYWSGSDVGNSNVRWFEGAKIKTLLNNNVGKNSCNKNVCFNYKVVLL
jgi:hypothetical protein